jgi:phosphate transport system protein
VCAVSEFRVDFHRKLQDIEIHVMQLFEYVSADLALATEGLLQGDPDVLRVVSEREAAIDELYAELERLGTEQLILQGPLASEFRLLVSVLRVVPELERSHDLVLLNAQYATHSLQDSLTPRTQTLVRQMSGTGAEMWAKAAAAWSERDASAVEPLLDRDEEMDGLHAALTAELASGAMDLPVTMDMTLVARNFERLGAHAVNIARRVVYLAGEEPGS